MAFIRDYTVTEFATAAASGTAEMPDHESGDMIIVFAMKDTNAAMSDSTGGAYTSINIQGGTDSFWGSTWYRRATSSGDTPPSFTWSSETAVIITISVGNPHPTNAPTGVVMSADDTTIPYTSTASKTTPSNNCLVFYGCAVDIVQGPTSWPTDMQAIYGGDVTQGGCGVGWMFYPTSGTQTDGVRFFGNTADSIRIFTVVVEDDGNNSIVPAYVDQTSTAPEPLFTLSGAALTFNGRAVSFPVSVTRTVFGHDFTQCWDYTGSVYNDETTDMNDVGTADVTLTNTTSGIFYFGYSVPFSQMAFTVSTAGTGSPTAVWEYYNGSTWATIPNFGTQNFIATGNIVQRFSPPSAWASTAVNSVTAYYIRRRVTAVWTIAPVISQGTIDGMGVLYDAQGNVADVGLNPYWSTYALSGPGTVPDGNNQVGSEVLFGTTLDLNPGYILTTWQYSTPRDLIDCGTYHRYKGVSLGIMDTSNNYKAWIIGAKDGADTAADNRMVVGVQPAQTTDTSWAAQGSFDANSVDTFAITASSAVAAVAAQFSGLWLVNGSAILSGGTAANPIGFADITDALVRGSGLFPTVLVDVSAATFYIPVQIGGGDPVNCSVNLRTLQFPTQASAAAKTGTWHVDDDTVGIEFYGKSGDSISFLSCTFTADSSYYWRFNASASSSCDWDFSGTTVAGATVTLRNVTTFDSMTFNRCSEIVLNDADLNNCTLKNQREGNNSSAVAFTSTSEGNGVTSCIFTDNNDGDLGHSIRITATGTYTFDGHTFSGGGVSERNFNTGSGVNSGTDIVTTDAAHGYSDGDAIYYQDQGGSVNMGLTDGSLYYVNAQSTTTLSFHTTKANAIADTSKVNLTSGGSETHYIYSAKADVYNDSGGTVTLSITNGGGTPSVRNSDGASTTINNAVTLSVTVKDSNGTAIQHAQIWIQKESTDSDYGHQGNPFTSGSGNNQGDVDFVVTQTPPSDLPSSGWLRIQDESTGEEQTYRYASKSANTFTFISTVTGTDNGSGNTTTINETGIGAKNIVEGDTIRNTSDGQWAVVLSVSANSVTTTTLSGGATWAGKNYSVHTLAVTYVSGTDEATVPLMNEETDGSGIATASYNYIGDKNILVRIRLASGSPDYLPYSTAGVITSSGYSLSATLQDDSIKS